MGKKKIKNNKDGVFLIKFFSFYERSICANFVPGQATFWG